MINDRYQKRLIAMLSLIVLVAIIGIAYAAFTGQLNINGEGVNRNSNFKIYFDNLSNGLTTGTAQIISNPEIKSNKTIIEDYKVKLISPGDSVTFTFDLINEGDYDVILADKILGPIKLSVNGDESDPSALNLQNYITYKLYDTDTNQELGLNTELNSKDIKHLKLVLKYLDTIPADKLPKDNVEISNLGVELVFEQSSIAAVDEKGKIFPNELMSAPIKPSKDDLFLSTNIARKDIYTLNIVGNKDIPSGYQSSDCSEAQNRTVMCWWKESLEEPGYYDMYIGSNGKVYAPTDSSSLFRYVGYDKMKKLDLGDYFDTSHVTDMNRMFYKTGGLAMTELDLGTNFDTSKVTDMNTMFYSTHVGDFNDPKDSSIATLNLGNKFDTSNVTNMAWMFSYLMSLTELNLGDKFDTSNVVNMHAMIEYIGYNNMTSLDLGNKFDTSKVTDMSYMFDCTGYNKLTSLDLGDKFDTSKVTDMSFMFNKTGYNNMTNLNLGNKFDTSKVTNMHTMFQCAGYSKLASLNLGNKFDTSKVTDMGYMFNKTGQNKLTSLDLGDKFDTSNVTNMTYTFNRLGYYALREFNMGNFGVNHSKVTNTYSLMDEIGYPNSTLQRVIVKNQDVANWLNGIAAPDVPDYVKNKIVISTDINP